MRINKTKSKNVVHYSIIQDIKKNGKRTTYVYENIGNYDKLKLRAGNEDPLTWLNNYVKELNEKYKEDSLPVIIQKNPNKIIDKNCRTSFNIGYLFLQDIYVALSGKNPIVLIEKFEEASPIFNRMLSELVLDGSCVLNKRYSFKNNQLIEVTSTLCSLSLPNRKKHSFMQEITKRKN